MDSHEAKEILLSVRVVVHEAANPLVASALEQVHRDPELARATIAEIITENRDKVRKILAARTAD